MMVSGQSYYFSCIVTLLFFFLVSVFQYTIAAPTPHYCRHDQRDALLEFKHEFPGDGSKPDDVPDSTSFSSWNKSSDCCSWEGVKCDAKSGQEQEGNSNKAKSGEAGIKKDLPEVSPEAKAKAAEAKARGQDAFHRKDFQMAIDAYTQAIAFDPTDHTLFSNRSLCWLRLGQAEHALSDAKTCRELKPDWPKGCFREGAALRLRQRFDEAANAFYEGVLLSPESKELVDAFREAVDAGRVFHGKEKVKAKP